MTIQRSLSMRSSVDEKQQAAMVMRDSKTDKFYVEQNDGCEILDGTKRKRFLCWMLTKKQWIGALIGTITTVILALLLIIFLAIMPAIFQNQVDRVHLTMNHMDIKSIINEGTANKLNIELSVHLDADISAKSTIDGTDVDLYYQDKKFMTVPLPTQHLIKGKNSFDIVIQSEVDVSDEATFRALSKKVISEKEVNTDARMRVKVHAKGLVYGDLKLERMLVVKGMQQLQDPAPVFNDIALNECTETAYKLVVNVTLNNAGMIGVSGIGALNLSVYNPVGYLGQAITLDTAGMPRGPKATVLNLTIIKDGQTAPAFAALVSGLLAMNAPMYATGDHPYAMNAPLLSDAFDVLNVSLSYVDGLKKLTFNPACDITAIVSSAMGLSNTTNA